MVSNADLATFTTMKFYYLGIENEAGLQILTRLTEDYEESTAIVDQMNQDMNTTAYTLIGDARDPDRVELPMSGFKSVIQGLPVYCVIEELRQEHGNMHTVTDSTGRVVAAAIGKGTFELTIKAYEQ